MPANERLLRLTGFYDYANGNIDQLKYLACSAFTDGDRTLGGRASVDGNRRVAQVAAQRSDVDVTATIVHEAAHLEVWGRGRNMNDSEEYARSIEQRFLHAYSFQLQRSH
ncbi:hypothetical protein L0156_10295 [bacterium]|nr:hypothetical protein [bacterium]